MSASRIFWATVVALGVFNIARGLGAFGTYADSISEVLALLLTVTAVRFGMSSAELGLSRSTIGRGLLWGLGAFAVVLIVIVVAALIPATSEFLNDSRADVSASRLLFELIVGIGLGTVLPEELIFRGVLLGSAVKKWGTRVGMVAASLVFGLWHIFPTLSTAGGNEQFAQADSSTLGKISLMVGAVFATTVAGLIFSWLRLRSQSLVAPMIAHLSTNGVALTVAWFVAR